MKERLLSIIIFFASICLLLPSSVEATTIPSEVENYVESKEVIKLFESDIIVNEDGSLTVTESITVNALHEEIKHGIYRAFPISYTDKLLFKRKAGFEILSIKRDNHQEPYHTEQTQRYKRIYIGSEDTYVPKGTHTYKITYTTDRQLGYFLDYDELYYNITGNGWSFPILQAKATVTLPYGIEASSVLVNGYTGPSGATETSYNADISKTTQGSVIVSVKTTERLDKEEGLTIKIGWQKGFIEEPSKQQKLHYFLEDNIFGLIGFGIASIVLIYYFCVWLHRGRDPEKQTIIPQFEPPKGLSPAIMRYINKMEFDNKHVSTALVSSAAKGAISITYMDHEYTITLLNLNAPHLSIDEQQLLPMLFPEGKIQLTINWSSQKQVKKAISHFKKFVLAESEKYVHTNKTFRIPAIVASIGVSIVMSFSFSIGQSLLEFFLFTIWVSAAFLGNAWFWMKPIAQALKDYPLGGKSGVTTRIGILFVAIILFVPLYIGVWIMTDYVFISYFEAITILLLLLVNTLFYVALKVRTREGRQLQDHIKGFEMFLKATEKERMQILHQQIPKSISLYERFLPFAIALDIESKWTRQFKEQLDAYIQQNGDYSPVWYSGGVDFSGNAFGSTFSSSFSDAFSSINSSGAGSSGGGGGGGGGGGW